MNTIARIVTAASLVLNVALAAMLLDGSISLDHCRSELRHLRSERDELKAALAEAMIGMSSDKAIELSRSIWPDEQVVSIGPTEVEIGRFRLTIIDGVISELELISR